MDYSDYWQRPAHEIASEFGFGGSVLLWWLRTNEIRKIKKEAQKLQAAKNKVWNNK